MVFSCVRCGAFFCSFLLICFAARGAYGKIQLLDGSLELTGYIREYLLLRTHIPTEEKKFHKSNFDFAQTGLLVEGLYRFCSDETLEVNLFGGMRFWYEKALSMDTELKGGIPHRARKDYVRPRDDEYFTEAYLDISSGHGRLCSGNR